MVLGFIEDGVWEVYFGDGGDGRMETMGHLVITLVSSSLFFLVCNVMSTSFLVFTAVSFVSMVSSVHRSPFALIYTTSFAFRCLYAIR